MLTTHYAQVGAMLAMSHEVVNRLAISRDEDGQCAYHAAKCDYQLTMNRISSRLPPTMPNIKMIDDEFSTYCSSNAESLSGTMRKSNNDGIDCTDIDRELYVRALKRQESDKNGGRSWKRESSNPMELLLQRETLARRDVEDVEHEFFRNMTEPFYDHPFMSHIQLVKEETRERKIIEDAWMTESLPFLDQCATKQVEFTEAFWSRAFGRLKNRNQDWQNTSPQMESIMLDIRLYQPLLHHCETIRRETESEEEIAFLYLQLGEAAQRDLIAHRVMHRNKKSGLLDSIRHPIEVRDYDQVDFAFSTEFRYLESREETQRMNIIDAWLQERQKFINEFMTNVI